MDPRKMQADLYAAYKSGALSIPAKPRPLRTTELRAPDLGAARRMAAAEAERLTGAGHRYVRTEYAVKGDAVLAYVDYVEDGEIGE